MKKIKIKKFFTTSVFGAMAVAPIVVLACSKTSSDDMQETRLILEEANSTQLTGESFALIEIPTQEFTDSIKIQLGLIVKNTPSGVAITITKPKNSLVVSYTLSKVGEENVKSFDVVFRRSDSDASFIEENRLTLEGVNRTELLEAEFQAINIQNEVAFDEVIKEQLGLSYLQIDQEVFVRIKKPANSKTVFYRILRGLATPVGGSFDISDFAPNPIPDGTTTLTTGMFASEFIPGNFVIPTSVKTIEARAFENARLPVGFEIPSSVTTVATDAFLNANFIQESLANTFSWLNEDGSAEPKPGSIVGRYLVPSTTTIIEAGSFKDKEIGIGTIIPKSVTTIAEGAFENAKVNVGYRVSSKSVSLFQFERNSKIRSIGKNAFVNVKGLREGFTIPQTIASIGEGAFAKIILPEGFALPNTVTEISISAFNGSTLPEGFTLSSNIVSIRSSAFQNAILPTSFVVPSSVTLWGESVFNGAILPEGFSLKNATPPADKILPKQFLANASIQLGFRLFDNLEVLGESSLQNASLPIDFVLPSTTKIIFRNVFEDTILPRSFTLNEGLVEISENAFKGVDFLNLNRFSLPSSLKTIRSNAFQAARLKVGFKIPSNVTNLGDDLINPFRDAIIPTGYKWSVLLNKIPQAGAEIVVDTDY